MPIRFTPLVAEHYYHVFNRGVNKRPIFKNRRDYSRFLLSLRFYKSVNCPVKFSKFIKLANEERRIIWQKLEIGKAHADVLAYCLMPNHFHLLLKQNTVAGISKLLADLQNSYARYFNIKYDRIGPLFQGQFKAVRLDSDDQLLHVSRYIHLNPYSSAIVKDLNELFDYEWSSFPEYTKQLDFEMCSKNLISSNFKNKEAYAKFVSNNADYQKTLDGIKHLTFD